MTTAPIATVTSITEHRTPSRVPLQADTSVTITSTPSKWEAVTPTEKWALAHLRGWTHPGPVCPLCMGGVR
jgi:hypothetical protein